MQVSEANTKDDRTLIQAAASGDAQAFRELYQLHRSAIVRRLSHLVGSQGQTEDLVQETFLRAFRSLRTYRFDSPVRHWLLRIATNLARDTFRRRQLRRWLLWTAETDSAEGRASTYPELATVHAALERLSPKLREAVILHELEGVTFAELSAQLGISINTAGSRVRLGRTKLRGALEKLGFDEQTSAQAVLCEEAES